MKNDQLQEIFPDARQKTRPSEDQMILSVPLESGYLWIDKEQLSERERQLISALTSPPDERLQRHTWYRILFEKVLPDPGTYRIFQLRLNHKRDFMEKEWKENIRGMFPYLCDLFFLDKQQVVVVEREHPQAFDAETLAGIFLTLDEDFDTSTQLFIGSWLHSSEDVSGLFAEEHQIFLEESPFIRGKQVFSLADVALHYFTKDSFSKSRLIQAFRRQLTFDQEMSDIIQALWNNHGNISSAAKELFMHRNTLQYRMEKFQEHSGLNLKNIDELILCYLLMMNDRSE